MTYELHVGDLLYTGDACKIFATNDENLAVMEWESEEASRLAEALHQVARSHALSTNFVDRLGATRLIVKRIEPLPVTVIARTDPNETGLEMIGSSGDSVPLEEATKIPGLKPNRLDMIVDTSQHLARSLRAHLAPTGVEHLELKLTFGVGPQGESLLQVPNPLACNLGTTDYEALCTTLGGDPK